ncbi:hypothetical protein BWI97_22020 [Siphonobacter sp. BAB-5405]|uniref:hypothetical protein n=1 Tax=Siphonobacter sp. BAB-5405 TaxID=1864825 RepID=UPI000C810705|nr:hypothetical protein [Siphonobacter sp. BAB-5405]PMD91252.1 hypothetical protein BWI97_22020 [Siphonobacter sp. BAB-5405]
MKKKYLPLILLTASLASTLASGQVNHVPSYEMNPRSSLLKIAVDDGFKNGWLRIKDSVSITPAIFISRYSTELGLTNSDVLTPVDTVVDLQKNVHIKYKQYHKGIPVMGADYTIHLKNGRVYQVNGKIAESLNIDTKPVISKNSAFQASVASYMKSGSQHKRSL